MTTTLWTIATALLAQGGDFDPNTTINRGRAVLIAVLSLVLIAVSVAAVIGPGRKGNTRKSVDIGVASLIALIPGAIGAAGLALVFATEVAGWTVPILNG